jgi:hypothetical protein
MPRTRVAMHPIFMARMHTSKGRKRMKHSIATGLAATVFAIGLALAPAAHARDTISDEEAGMVCDDSTAGYYLDIDFRLYQCNGRNWVYIGSI